MKRTWWLLLSLAVLSFVLAGCTSVTEPSTTPGTPVTDPGFKGTWKTSSGADPSITLTVGDQIGDAIVVDGRPTTSYSGSFQCSNPSWDVTINQASLASGTTIVETTATTGEKTYLVTVSDGSTWLMLAGVIPSNFQYREFTGYMATGEGSIPTEQPSSGSGGQPVLLNRQ